MLILGGVKPFNDSHRLLHRLTTNPAVIVGQTRWNKLAHNYTIPTIKATLDSPRPLGKSFACSNVNSVRVASWSDRNFWQAVNQLNPAVIRIPGGTSSSYWDWRKGGLIDDDSKLPTGLVDFLDNPRDRQYNASKLEDWHSAFAKHDKVPLFVVNMLSDNLESQLEMLRTARDLGMPVKYIELGNEFYFPLENYRAVFPSIKTYTKTANRWIAAIRKEFPQAQIAVMGVARPGDKSSRISRWNQTIIEQSLPLANAITIHTYSRNGLRDSSITSKQYPYFESSDIPLILGEPFRNWQKVSQIISDFPSETKIWVTEYNLMEDIHATEGGKRQRIAGSWLHGLYTISMSLLFLEDPRIDLACNHMLVGSSQFSTILSNENSLLDPSNPQTTNEPLSLSATGHTQQFLGDVTQGMTQAQKINFGGNYFFQGNENQRYPALYGWSFGNQKQDRKSLLLNLSAQPIEIDISNLSIGSVEYHTIHSSPKALVTNPEKLQHREGTSSQNIVLPPYSITKLDNKENKK